MWTMPLRPLTGSFSGTKTTAFSNDCFPPIICQRDRRDADPGADLLLTTPSRTLGLAGSGLARNIHFMIIRSETPDDISFIRALTDAAFVGIEHSSQTEGAIVDALRKAGALSPSLVAEQGGSIIGHVGFSPVMIDGEDIGWYGLGPVSVSPGHQRGGVGSALVKEGLQGLTDRGAQGCVVLGDPEYYGRFGFTSAHALYYGEVPAEYFQSLVLAGAPVAGEVAYHAGFEAT